MALGDIAALRAHAIDVGSVFKMRIYPEDGVKPKNEGETYRDKRLVIVGKTQDAVLVGSLLINSEINDNMFTKIAPYQHCIYPDQYDFLNDKERYIDCYKIFEFDFDRILDTGEYVGQINPDDIAEAIKCAKGSPVNSTYTLKKFKLI